MWVIANPAAGGGRGGAVSLKLPSILRSLGLKFHYTETRRKGEAGALAQAALEQGCRKLVVCGGDGTLQEVATGLCRSHCYRKQAQDGSADNKHGRFSIGLIPCGRGNDLARYLGIPRELEKACRALAEGCLRELDVVEADNNQCYLTVAGVGLTATVAEICKQERYARLGWGAYIAATLKVLPRYKPLWIRLEYDEGVWEGEAALVAAANTTMFGGGLPIAPLAQGNDGLLDVCIVDKLAPWRIARTLPLLLVGRHLNHPAVHYFRTRAIKLQAENQPSLFADGEFLQKLPATLSVRHKALSFLVP